MHNVYGHPGTVVRSVEPLRAGPSTAALFTLAPAVVQEAVLAAALCLVALEARLVVAGTRCFEGAQLKLGTAGSKKGNSIYRVSCQTVRQVQRSTLVVVALPRERAISRPGTCRT